MTQYHFDPDTYLANISEDIPVFDELQAAVAGATRGVTAKRILELGVGTGETAERVLSLHPGAELVGIDENERMLAVARAAIAEADLRTSRLEDPLPEGPFELVVSALAVHHLRSEEKADLFRRIARELRVGGRFVLGDVIVPDRPEDAVTPCTPDFDRPDRVDDQLRWLAEAGFAARLIWIWKDLAVLQADLGAVT
jgi:SAM-dependent methyltransferase